MQEEEIRKIIEENQNLQVEIDQLKNRSKKRSRFKFWLLKIGSNIFIGKGLKRSLKNSITDFNENKRISIENVSDLGASIIRRFTRIGFFAILVGLLPTLLLVWQNRLIRNQNEMINIQTGLFERQNLLFYSQNQNIDEQTKLFAAQNKNVEEQTKLFASQNKNVEEQTNLMRIQNLLFVAQNKKVDRQTNLMQIQNALFLAQNDRIDKQNDNIEKQTFLAEASRRSAQVFLMADVLSDMNNELNEENSDSRILSDGLVGRIISLSSSMKPYKYLKGDSLINQELSPERAQLFISLLTSDIDSTFLANELLEKCNFGYSDFEGANLQGINVSHVNLEGSCFHKANLSNSRIINSTLMNTDFRKAVLNEADLSGSDISNSDLTGVDLTESTLIHVNFSNSKLIKANFKRAIYRGVQIDVDHYLDKLYDELESKPYISAAFFQRMDYDSNFSLTTNTDFSKASFFKADLRFQTFGRSNFDSVDFSKADMEGTHFRWSDLSNAFFQFNPILWQTRFESANLEGISVQTSFFYNSRIYNGCSLDKVKIFAGAKSNWKDKFLKDIKSEPLTSVFLGYSLESKYLFEGSKVKGLYIEEK